MYILCYDLLEISYNFAHMYDEFAKNECIRTGVRYFYYTYIFDLHLSLFLPSCLLSVRGMLNFKHFLFCRADYWKEDIFL